MNSNWLAIDTEKAHPRGREKSSGMLQKVNMIKLSHAVERSSMIALQGDLATRRSLIVTEVVVEDIA